MELPQKVQEILFEEINSIGLKDIKQTYQEISNNYRQNKEDKSINTQKGALSYALGRMPATYSVNKTVLSQINFLDNINLISDYGAGCGASSLALSKQFNGAIITAFEKQEYMRKLGEKLTQGTKITWQPFDMVKDTFNKADLILASYSVNEIAKDSQEKVIEKLLNSTNKIAVFIEAGTPQGYQLILKIREVAIKKGFNVLAPCKNNKKCPLDKNDWCAFKQRIERNKYLSLIKSATLSYEDENYSYLIVCKDEVLLNDARVLRTPIIKPKLVSLKLCTKEGIKEIVVTKSQGEKYKAAKKLKSGDNFIL